MSSSVNIQADAPTFHSLNKPQKRALILRDQLRYTSSSHLDGFIEGVDDPEPPAYRRINGVVYPPLVMVTLKDTATRYDLGNVHFENDISGAKGIHHAFLTVENGSFELRTETALPLDVANLASVPIHVFIARTMVSMFETKFQAIWARKNQINELRQVAFNMTSQPADAFQEGETLARLDDRASHNGSPSQSKKTKKRRRGEPVVKHSSNKREHVGLDTIPEDAKTATFNAIPNSIKVDLFNNVVKTAFPNFNNLMLASWNVVSIYSNVGTDFPELHKAIVDLKSVLQDFEQSLGTDVERKDPKPRQDLMRSLNAASHDGTDDIKDDQPAQPTPETPQEDGGAHGERAHGGGADDDGTQYDAAQGGGAEDASGDHYSDAEVEVEPQQPQQQEQDWDDQEVQPPQQQEEDVDSLFHEPEPQPDTTAMPPPRTLKRQRVPSETSDDQTRAPIKPRLSTHRTSSPHMRTTSPRLSSASPAPRASSPELQRRRSEYHTTSSLAVQPPSTSFAPSMRSHSVSESESASDLPNPEKKMTTQQLKIASLRASYKNRKASLIRSFGGNGNVPQHYRIEMQEAMRDIKKLQAKENEEQEREEAALREEQEEFEEGRGGAEEAMGRKKEVSEMPKFLGNSVLGGKKVGLGMAPIAPMVHLKKDGGKKGQ